MGLTDILVSAVAIADGVTSDIQVAVAHEPWKGSTASGGPEFGDAVNLSGILEVKQRMVKLRTGDLVMSRANITFLSPIAASGMDSLDQLHPELTEDGATGRREPIDPRDKLTLPDGTTGPILDTEGLMNPKTNSPFFLQVFLG